ncbi:Tetraspanin-3 [Dionaea muscipula]
MRASNHLIGLVNFLTFLLSIPILGGGIWLSSRANTTDCLRFLQWPLIIIGAAIMIVSLAGLAGACYRNTFLMYVYMWAMFLVIATLIGFVVFAYVVTDKGSGRPELNRAYMDYFLEDYSGWLERRVASDGYWGKISSCVRDSKVCAKMGKSVNGVPESANMFYHRKLTPLQSGCCKPATECGYTYVNETVWNLEVAVPATTSNLDCNRWSNDQSELCYSCDSCKAGVLASIKHSWRKASMINIVVVVLLVILYVVACAALRNNKRIDNGEPYGEARMTKAQPSRFF